MDLTRYTLNDFIHGRPERLFNATVTPKILVVWQHGDEELGPRFGYFIASQRPDLLKHVDYLCGNPVAAAHYRDKGFVDSDLNRAYNLADDHKNYEAQRAQQILTTIKNGNYNYVLDLHTTVTDVERLLIVQHDTPIVRHMISASPVKRVFVLSRDFGLTALAGHVPDYMAIEYNQKIAATPKAMDELATLVDCLIGTKEPNPQVREFYYMDGLIPKEYDPGDDARNFVLCKDGYYPVLIGHGLRSYREDPTKKYIGFAARRKEEFLL